MLPPPGREGLHPDDTDETDETDDGDNADDADDALQALEVAEAEDVEAPAHDDEGGLADEQARVLDRDVLRVDHAAVVVEARQVCARPVPQRKKGGKNYSR